MELVFLVRERNELANWLIWGKGFSWEEGGLGISSTSNKKNFSLFLNRARHPAEMLGHLSRGGDVVCSRLWALRLISEGRDQSFSVMGLKVVGDPKDPFWVVGQNPIAIP